MSYCLLEEDVAQLCSAIRTGDISDIQLLVEVGVDINSADHNGETALHVAVCHHQRDIVQELIDAGADVNVRNQNGQTPLHHASSRGYDDLVMLLMDAGADTSCRTQYTEMTPLHLAAVGGHTWTVKVMLENGANPNLTDVINKRAEFYSANGEIQDLFQQHTSEMEPHTGEMEQLQKTSSSKKHTGPGREAFSSKHKRRMKLNVFDRLTRRKSQVEK